MSKVKKALVLIDLQNDFADKEGALYVPKGEEVVGVANRLMATSNLFDMFLATQDYHCPGHKSFASSHEGKKPYDVIDLNGLQQTLWPDHCKWGEWGAEFHKNLLTGKFAAIFRKGMNREVDSYSMLVENDKRSTTGMTGYLRELKVEELYVMGLATDFCIRYSVLDALKEGFEVNVVVDGCKAVNLHQEDSVLALNEMKHAGAVLVKSDDLLASGMRELNGKEEGG